MGFDSYDTYSGVCIYMSPEGDANSQFIVITPEFSASINTLYANFWGKSTGSQLLVGTISDPADYNTFTPYDTVYCEDYWGNHSVYFNGYSGTDQYIAFKHNSADFPFSQLRVDDITIDAILSCVEPYKPYANSETQSSAWLHWTDPLQSATNWEIEAGAPSFTPGTGSASNTYSYSGSAAEQQSFEITGLLASTVYDVYLRTNCGSGDYSAWEGPVTILTLFDIFAGLPVTEDFESGMGITGNDPANGTSWSVNTGLFHGGAHSVHNAYGNSENNILYLLGTFDLTGKSDVMLSFWHIAKTYNNYDHCYVEISTDGGTTYDQLPESTYAGAGFYRESDLYNNPEGPCFDELSYPEWGIYDDIPDNSWWKKEYFDLSGYNTFNSVVIRFRLVTETWTTRAGWYIDDISVDVLGTPGINVDPLTISEDVCEAMPASVDLTIGNSGDFPANYTATVVYNETELQNENFDGGIPATWGIVNNGNNAVTWAGASSQVFPYYDFDGTPFALCDGNQNYGAVTITMDDELISPAVDASAFIGGALQLEFDQAFDANWSDGDTAKVYVFDGSEWIKIYESWNDDGLIDWSGNGVHKVYDVSAFANANFQVKFRYIDGPVNRGQYFAIDNFRLRASMSALGWLKMNGEETVTGVSMPDADNLPSIVNVNMDATGLALGSYSAEILVTSNDAANPSHTVPVTMNVIPAVALEMTLFLEGAYDALTTYNMFTHLTDNGFLPMSQPFNPPVPYFGNAAPVWFYGGTESVTEFPAGTVDWVLVELRDAVDVASASAAPAIATQAAFLLNDGSVAGSDGNRLVFKNVSVAQNLFVVIYHRNHIPVLSNYALAGTNSLYSYDFSTGADQVYGGANTHKEISAGVWGMMSGDGNGSGQTDNKDKNDVWIIQAGTGSGYHAGDFNMNGTVDNTDNTDYWRPNSGKGSQLP